VLVLVAANLLQNRSYIVNNSTAWGKLGKSVLSNNRSSTDAKWLKEGKGKAVSYEKERGWQVNKEVNRQ
jgi:hypothetical protein